MRFLTIVLAETRGHEVTFGSFKRNVLDPLDSDLALCVGDNIRENVNNEFYQLAKFKWILPEPNDFGDYLKSYIIVNYPNLLNEYTRLFNLKNQFLGGIKESLHPGSAGILICFRDFLRNKLVENNLLLEYDYFIITRSDFIHTVPHPSRDFFTENSLHFPLGEGYGFEGRLGITDRHVICSSRYVLDVLDIWGTIFSDFEENLVTLKRHEFWNLEKIIFWHLEKKGLVQLIRYLPYTYYSVRLDNVTTTWTHGQWHNKYKYYIKYRTEFISAQFYKIIFIFMPKNNFYSYLVILNPNNLLVRIFNKIIWKIKI